MQALSKLPSFQMPRHAGQCVIARGKRFQVCLVQAPRLGDPAFEGPRGDCQNAVYEVAQRRHEFVVVSPDVPGPREVGVRRFGHDRREVVPERVRLIPFKVVGQPDRPVLAGRKPAALECQELVGGHIVRQVQPAVAHQHRRPDDRVKRDIVLALEVETPGVRVFPPRPPGLRFSVDLRPFLRGRQVADHCLEPDVDPLVFVPVDRNLDAPFDVSGDGAIVQPVSQQPLCEVADIRTPMILLRDPLFEPLLERTQAQGIVPCVPELRRRAVLFAPDVAELDGI